MGPVRALPHAWSHLVINLTILAVEWRLFLLGGCWQLVHSTATNVVYYLEATRMTGAQRLPLHDLSFEVLPLLSGFMWGLSDLLLLGIISFVVAMVPLSLVAAFRKPDRRPLYIAFAARRFFLSLVLLQTLRMVSFTVTLLPGSSFQCLYTLTDAQKASAAGTLAEGLASPEGNSAAWNPPRNLPDVLLTMDAWTGCGDLMFSSHMIFAMLCCMTVSRYFPWRAAKVLVLAAVLVMVPLTLAARKHYTLDVFTSLYVVPCVYELLYLKFPDKVNRCLYSMKEHELNSRGLSFRNEACVSFSFLFSNFLHLSFSFILVLVATIFWQVQNFTPLVTFITLACTNFF